MVEPTIASPCSTASCVGWASRGSISLAIAPSERVQAESNGQIGSVIGRATVRGNTANRNRVRGIVASCPSTIVENTAANNGLGNLTGVRLLILERHRSGIESFG